MIALVCMMVSFVPASVGAQESDEAWATGKRYNIMLVIDGSGSLISKSGNMEATDPEGMRYDLLDDLLGILEDDGHYLGAVVFSGNKGYGTSDEDMESGIRLNTGMLSLDEMAPDGSLVKDYVANQVEKADVDRAYNSTTDVGTALLVAERELQKIQKKNGLESLVFLFTDGVTEIFRADVLERSQENLTTATREMNQNDIRMFGAFLNKNGRINSSEISDMVCAANGISKNSVEFANSYVEIKDAASCHEAVTVLLRFLGYIAGTGTQGVDNIDSYFTIPGIGVEEFNIRLYSYAGEDLPEMTVMLTMPDGTVLEGMSLNSLCRSGRTIRVYKVQKPMPGQWRLQVILPENNTVTYVYDQVYSLLVGSSLSITPDLADLHVNCTASFAATLSQKGQTITDPLAYTGYTCRLEIQDHRTNEIKTYDIEGTDGVYVKDLLLDTYGRFSARTVFSCAGFEVPSSFISYELFNHEPEIRTPIPVDVKYGPLQDKTTTLDLSKYVNDLEDGTNLKLVLTDSQCNADGFSLDGFTLNMTNVQVGSGTLTFQVTDSQGAGGELKVNVKSINTLPRFIALIVILLILAALVVVFFIRKREGQNLKGDLSVTLGLEVEREKSIELDLQIPGREAANKTNLKTLINHALVNEADRVKPGITCGMVKAALSPYMSGLEKITLTKVMTRDAGKSSAGILIKQGSKKYIMPGKRMVDLYVDDMSVSLVYARPMDEDDDMFGTDMDFAAPSRGKKEKKGAAKRENVSDFDDDLF